jgi:hypothetical protein
MNERDKSPRDLTGARSGVLQSAYGVGAIHRRVAERGKDHVSDNQSRYGMANHHDNHELRRGGMVVH